MTRRSFIGRTLSCGALFAVTVSMQAAPLPPCDDLLDFSYTIDRRGVEKKAGALSDGDSSTGASWHTKQTSRTEIVCELKESSQVDRVEIFAPKWTKWYIIKDVRIAVDDGFGDFGDPIVLPGHPLSNLRQKEDRDASCTNHVFTVTNLGKVVRVKVTIVSDAVATISEIRLHGKKNACRTAKCDGAQPSVSRMVFAKNSGDFRVLENGCWRLEFNPLGGRAMRLFSKAIGAELTNPEAAGSFVEEVWDRRKSHDFLIKQPYVMTYSGEGGKLLATAVGNAQGGGIDFLRVTKRFSSDEDSTALKVDYRFENIPEAMALQNYGILIHATLGVFGRDVTCYFPTTDGIVAMRPGHRGNEYWGHRPARGWMAAATDDGTGVAVTMPIQEVKTFYSWFSQVPTLEWRMIPIGLEAGAGYDISTEIIPFKGLVTVSGAGGGLVGSLTNGVCTVVSARAGRVTAEADGQTVTLSFAKPGATATFRTAARTVVLKREGQAVCRLEAPSADTAWTLAREGEPRGSSVKEADLTCYTNFPRTVCTAWGKPLAGRRLKVAVLTGNGNQIEVGRLAERFDFDYRTVGVIIGAGYPEKRSLGNPIFSDGDNFSLINTSDLERGMANVLKCDADVILVGGVPFEVFTKELRELLVKKVKGGTGLVWIGQDRNVPELGFKLKDGKLRRVAPQANGPLFASVPFALLGDEAAYSIDAAGGIVHATCGDSPYIVETTFGKGRVFNIAYRALSDRPWPAPGLTPANLRDFYETREAPVEHYYSLIAKTLLAAAGRTLPVTFGEIAFSHKEHKELKGRSETSLRLCVSAGESKKTCWEWRVRDPFGRELASGKRDVALAAGKQTVTFDALDIPRAQGPLAFELVVRDAKGVVQNWGAWAFKNEPMAVISAFSLDGGWRTEGEETTYSATVVGDTAGMRMEVSLVDSYGRTLAKHTPAVSKEVKGRFRIENALPARCCLVEAKLFGGDGTLVSHRRAELRVRPKPERYAWDDFEVGTWANAANREYLWPDLAALYHKIGISTIIANPERMQKEFTMRHNIHPTLLLGAGLHRCAEPHEYTKTGDKMKLIRPTCLSSPDFFAKREKSLQEQVKTLARYAMRFIWFGDEQSITGYGGNAVDFCFSEDCLREMRAFAKGKYGTLDRLNAEWETRFKDWDEVVPFTRQEVWAADGRHVAGWADHLEFMDSRLTNSVAFSVRALHAADPAVRFALSGTQAPSAYGGMDWWKQLGVMDAALSYGGGGQWDIHRSFCPDGGFMPWNWGYSRRGAAAVLDVWKTAFVGSRGLMGFQSSSQINNDWTFSRGLRDTLPHVRRLVTGTGKHFVQNLVAKHEVAILYSQASLRAAFIENRREEHDKLEEKVRQLLGNLGYAYDYISYEQLASGVATARGYRALILADALALSDEEVAGVKAFAAAGGTVIAEGMPATRKGNCRKRGTSPLADLFKDKRHSLFPTIDVGYLKAIEYPDKPENARVVAADRSRYETALVRAGVSASRLGIVDLDLAKPVVNTRVYPKEDRAGNPVWCVLAPYCEKTRDVRFVFPRAAWTYDLVSGRAYGRVRELHLPLGKGTPYAFVQFPEAVRIGRLAANGARLSVAYTAAVDGVVRLTVMRPDGTEAECYAKNLLMKGGRVEHEIPFTLSDPKGTWTVRAVSVFGGDEKMCGFER